MPSRSRRAGRSRGGPRGSHSLRELFAARLIGRRRLPGKRFRHFAIAGIVSEFFHFNDARNIRGVAVAIRHDLSISDTKLAIEIGLLLRFDAT